MLIPQSFPLFIMKQSTSYQRTKMPGALSTKKVHISNEWQDVAGKFANASPAIKQALKIMRDVRHAD